MGWMIDLKAQRAITAEEVEKAIGEMPESMHSTYPSRQEWGWSLAVDVKNPQGDTLRISGSYGQSGKIAEGFAQALARQLEKLGHEIDVGEMS